MTTKTDTPGVIFDLDGTLVDTLDDISDCLEVVMVQRGLAFPGREEIRRLIGHGLKDLLRRASHLASDEEVTTLVGDYRSLYKGRMLEKSRLFPGVGALLDVLAGRSIPMAVLSNKPDEFTVPICEALLADWPFVRFRGSLGEAGRKPDPAMALRLAEEMGRAASRVYFVGDSSIDMQTALNAGMVPLGVSWGYREAAELTSAGVDRVAERPDVLAGWIV